MPVAGGSTFWNAERRAQLRTQAAAGLTARAIAEQLGCSRNAVISKANREGYALGRHDERTPEQRREARLAYLRNYHAEKRGTLGFTYRPRASKQTPVEAPPVEVPAKQLALTDLGVDMCHWPVSAEPPHCFCGNDTAGHVYCPFHHALGINKNQGRRPDRLYVF